MSIPRQSMSDAIRSLSVEHVGSSGCRLHNNPIETFENSGLDCKRPQSPNLLCAAGIKIAPSLPGLLETIL